MKKLSKDTGPKFFIIICTNTCIEVPQNDQGIYHLEVHYPNNRATPQRKMISHLEEPLQWVHMHVKLSQMMFYFVSISYQPTSTLLLSV